MSDLSTTLDELITRPGHEKVRALMHRLLVDGLNVPSVDIDFERPAPEVHGRIDALLGRTVLEFKSDLRKELRDSEEGLTRYLKERETATGQRYVGIATDGATFAAYERGADEQLNRLAQFVPAADDVHGLLAWLQSVLAVGDEIAPEPERVRRELGRDSPAYRRAAGELAVLWEEVGRLPAVNVKRQLWDNYLQHVYGTRVGEDDLFLQHTYLTIIAKTMATSVLGARPSSGEALLSGEPFSQAGITGAVESDFFDWVLSASKGGELVMRLARHVGRFRLSDIEHDVLKGLYESLIDPEQRHDLGEYYTPDWLANWMCGRAITDPLEQRVLDPACGSGTFLFHAVRQFLDAAQRSQLSPEDALGQCTDHVLGIDVHPVAVAFARVTYLLAIGEDRLRARPARLNVPVYMGDSLQWNTEGFFGRRDVRVAVPNGPVLLFPTEIAEDAARFDATVQAMIEYSDPPAAEVAGFRGWLRKNGITDNRDIATLERTYEDMVALRAAGRDHIWGYVLRNLSRPFALSSPERRVDIVVGNPPWLSYRYMEPEMQARFREECQERRLWTGGKVATHQDLSAYFFTRCTELYLNDGGTTAFVMPHAALTRQQFRGFQSQQFGQGKDQLLQFEEVWAFDETVKPLFPVPSCAIFARRGGGGPRPGTILSFAGTLPRRDAHSAEAEEALSRSEVPWPDAGESIGRSPYARAFRQGATIVPRRFWIVERAPAGRFGANPEAPLVRSRTSRQEKAPWRDLAPLEGNIEQEFIYRLFLGASVAPFRLLSPVEAIIPWDEGSGSLLTADRARARGCPELARWLSEADGLWQVHRRSERFSALERLDYHRGLSAQFPPTQVRVVYSKSGKIPTAAMLLDTAALVDHVLYWASVNTIQEAQYLVAIFNSEALRRRIESRQSRGQWGARDIHKLLVKQPIPRYSENSSIHSELVMLADHAESVAATVSLPADLHFVTARRRVREALADDGVAGEIDTLVETLLGQSA